MTPGDATEWLDLITWRLRLLIMLDYRILILMNCGGAEVFYYCGACIAGRPEECSGWCANHLTGTT